MEIIRYVSKDKIIRLKNWEIDVHKFIETSSIEKRENYYSWEEDEMNIIPIKITIPDREVKD